MFKPLKFYCVLVWHKTELQSSGLVDSMDKQIGITLLVFGALMFCAVYSVAYRNNFRHGESSV